MTDEVSDGNVDMDDLNSFENAFYNRKTEEESEVKEEVQEDEVDETESDQLATEVDEDAETEEENSEEDDSSDEEEEESVEEPQPKKNRKSAKERIEELVTEARVAQRERDAEKAQREAIEQRLRLLEQGLNKEVPKAETEVKAPDPNALNDKGESLYALGEFDPLFIRDLTKFTIEQETKAFKEQEARATEDRAKQEAVSSLQKEWAQKVEKVKEELPDYPEKVKSLVTSFDGIDPALGDYLASTIMSCDNGPEIMYYLSQNIGEAQNIVASGPFAATLAIGRLQARLEKPIEPVQEEKRNTRKVSEAPPPPDTRVRGKGGHFAVRPDTDDLDAFEKEFFAKKR